MLDLWVVRSVCMLTRRAYKLGRSSDTEKGSGSSGKSKEKAEVAAVCVRER